ncbi:MAG: FtsW/RodA/SpoVE family cell cycle protein [Deinococcota bacterium]
MDGLLILVQVLLGAMGVLGLATSEPMLSMPQVIRVILGLVITFVVARMPARTVVKLSPYAYLGVLFLLILTLFIGVSPEGSSSRRWLAIGGFTLQPSELMKVTVIAYLAGFFYNHLGDWQIWRPMLVLGLAAGAIVAEPDVSTALFVFLLAFVIMIAAGTTLVRLISISTTAALIAVIFAGPYLSQYSYIGERLGGYLDFRGERIDSRGSSYQALQAQRTLVRAGVIGVGPGRPIYVPEADTDMIVISIGHALGLLGIATLFSLYFVIAAKGVSIASRVEGPSALLAIGATIYICLQAGLNLLVASGLVPVTGIPLPFVSYGFNSLISVSIAMGFLHSASRELKLADAQQGAAV